MKSSIRRGITSGLVLLLVLSTITMVPIAASAASAEEIVMHVPNIPGSSTIVGHTGWIDVLSFAGSAVAPTSASTGQPCQMVVQKPLDIASPHLWVGTVTAQLFTTIRVQLLQPSTTGSPFVLYDIQLENVQFTSIGDSGSNALPSESVTLKATKVMLTFNKQNPDGSVTPVTTSFA